MLAVAKKESFCPVSGDHYENGPTILTSLFSLKTGLILWKFFDRFKSPFVRNISVVAAGTAGAQAIAVIFAPGLTRIYGAEAFGVLGTFTAMVTVVSSLSALAYPIAIVLPESDLDALGLVRLSVGLSVLMALLAGAGLLLFGDGLLSFLGMESMSGYLLLVPLAMLFSAWYQTAQQWLIRHQRFSLMARVGVFHSFLLNSAKAGIGWFYPLPVVLIFLATVGQALHSVLLGFGALRQGFGVAIPDRDTGSYSLKDLCHKYRDFPLYRMPQNFINAATQGLPVLLLASFFGPASAGFYTLASLVMGRPSSLVGKAVSDVFYPRVADGARRGNALSPMILRSTVALILLGVLPFGIVVIFGPSLFSFIFGGEWGVAGEYARWLALFFFFNFINKPSVAAVPVLGIQKGLLLYELFSTAGKAGGLLIGFFIYKSDIISIALFSLIGVVAYIVMIIWIISTAHRGVIYEKTSG